MPKRRAQVNTREAKPAKSMRTVREAARTGDAAVDKRNAKRLLYDASQGSGGKLAGVHRPPALQLARRDPARPAVEAEAQRPLHRSTRSRHQTPLPRPRKASHRRRVARTLLLLDKPAPCKARRPPRLHLAQPRTPRPQSQDPEEKGNGHGRRRRWWRRRRRRRRRERETL